MAVMTIAELDLRVERLASLVLAGRVPETPAQLAARLVTVEESRQLKAAIYREVALFRMEALADWPRLNKRSRNWAGRL